MKASPYCVVCNGIILNVPTNQMIFLRKFDMSSNATILMTFIQGNFKSRLAFIRLHIIFIVKYKICPNTVKKAIFIFLH